MLSIFGTLEMVALLERLKSAQDLEDALFLSGTIDRIISEWEKIKEKHPQFIMLFEEYKKEGINFDKIQ